MANAYWAEYVNANGFATLQTLIARSESLARTAFTEIEHDTADDPPGTVEIRLTKNGYVIDAITRKELTQ